MLKHGQPNLRSDTQRLRLQQCTLKLGTQPFHLLCKIHPFVLARRGWDSNNHHLGGSPLTLIRAWPAPAHTLHHQHPKPFSTHHTHTHTHSRTHAPTHARTYAPMHATTHDHTNTQTHKNPNKHSNTQKSKRTNIETQNHTSPQALQTHKRKITPREGETAR